MIIEIAAAESGIRLQMRRLISRESDFGVGDSVLRPDLPYNARSRYTTTRSMYLNGMEQKNPYPVLMAARSQIEVAAVVWDIVRIFKENAGDHEDRYLERVMLIDSELITATYGTRSEKVKELLPTMPARPAASFTTSHRTFGVIRSPQILPALLIDRNTRPSLI